jgi:hypothetical protein
MLMRMVKYLALAAGLALLATAAFSAVADAHALYGRQYYGGWSYYPQYGYYYRYYYYKPYADYDGYEHHYCIYYPSQPRYCYYYNPYKGYYWGRLDLEAKGDDKYQLLAEKDRKASVKDIPESAFPKPQKMPSIPGSKDDVPIDAPTDGPPK